MLLTRALVLSVINFYERKSPYEYVHSVIIELTKLILVGTRITYQATRETGELCYFLSKVLARSMGILVLADSSTIVVMSLNRGTDVLYNGPPRSSGPPNTRGP